MNSIETRAAGPPMSPGRSPGGGFKRSPFSEISKFPVSRPIESFKTVKALPSLELKNKLIPKIESKKTPEQKTFIHTPSAKGRERFLSKINQQPERNKILPKKLKESKPNTEVPLIFQQAFEKNLDPQQTKINKVTNTGSERFHKSAELRAKLNSKKMHTKGENSSNAKIESIKKLLQNQKISLAEIMSNPQQVSKGSERNQKLFDQKSSPKAEAISHLLKDQSIGLFDITKIEQKTRVKVPELIPTIGKREFIRKLLKTNEVSLSESILKQIKQKSELKSTRSEQIATLLRSNEGKLNDIFAKSIENPTGKLDQTRISITEVLNKTPNQTRREMLKTLMNDQSLTLTTDLLLKEIALEKPQKEIADQTKTEMRKAFIRSANLEKLPDKLNERIRNLKPLSINNAEIKKSFNLKILEQNLAVVKNVLESSPQRTIHNLPDKTVEQIIDQPNKIDFQQATNIVEQLQKSQMIEIGTADLQKGEPLKNRNEMKRITSQLIELNQYPEQRQNNQNQIEQKVKILSNSLMNPETKIEILPEQRVELLKVIKELSQKTEFQSNPTLSDQTKKLVKEIEHQIIEQQQLSETIIAMKKGGFEDVQIEEIVKNQIELKQLPFDQKSVETLLHQAEQKFSRSSVMTEAEAQQEDDEEVKKLLIEIKQLYIELDDNALAKRFNTLYKAVFEAHQRAQVQGKEFFTGSEIYQQHPQVEQEEEKSELIQNQGRGDGGHKVVLESINTSHLKFFSLEHAYDYIAKQLLANRPGRLREKIATTTITPEEVRKIFEDRPMPTAIINGNIINLTKSISTD